MRTFFILSIFLLLVSTTPAFADYTELDDQSGGIANGFGAWGALNAVQEPAEEFPDQGIVTVYHPDAAPSALPTIFFISGWGRPAETYQKFFEFLVSHNYTVVDIYNLNPGSINTSYPNALDMIQQTAVNHEPWIDTQYVGLMGHSFGGGAAVWVGKRIFGDWNWGADGKRFLFLTAPWLTFLTTREDLETYPADTKLHIQLSYDDMNTDPRAIRAVYELINIPSSEKDLVTVYSDPDHSYDFQGNTYHYLADHYISYTGIWGDVYHPYDALDAFALNRLAHAMTEYVFEGSAAAKDVALGNGSDQQTNMGFLPPLTVTDAPVIVRGEDQFVYRCSESAPGTWGDPEIWWLQSFCDDSNGDGIIDELQDLAGADDAQPQPAAGLLGIAPNPFNPRTRIRFQAAEAGPVTIRIYDLAGHLVRRLVNRPFPAGIHEVVWNGRDDQGFGLPSGTYLAQLKVGSKAFTSPMVLIR